MINLISTHDIPIALSQGASLIMISSDSKKALIRGELNDMSVESTFEDSQIEEIISDSFWKQPCKSCGDF